MAAVDSQLASTCSYCELLVLAILRNFHRKPPEVLVSYRTLAYAQASTAQNVGLKRLALLSDPCDTLRHSANSCEHRFVAAERIL